MPRHGSNDSEKNHVAYGLASAYSVGAFRVGQYVDQSSSRGLEKFGEDIPTIPEVIGTYTLNFRPNFFIFTIKSFLGETPSVYMVFNFGISDKTFGRLLLHKYDNTA